MIATPLLNNSRGSDAKNRWHISQGKVAGVRLPDSVHAIPESRAKKQGLAKSV